MKNNNEKDVVNRLLLLTLFALFFISMVQNYLQSDIIAKQRLFIETKILKL